MRSTNLLTERLLAEGYTKDIHPDYVQWNDGWKWFEYTNEFRAASVWETPCGLLHQGVSNGTGTIKGITHSAENNNPNFGCPFYGEIPCPVINDTPWAGERCTYHLTDKPFDYENSTDKIYDQWAAFRDYRKKAVLRGNKHCSCFKWNHPLRKWEPRFFPEFCMDARCSNEICSITGQKRDFEKVNIYYDVLRVWEYRIGFADFVEKKLQKGMRQFERPVFRTDAENWLKMYGHKRLNTHVERKDRSDEFFSEMHGETGFGEYERFKFTATVQNVRIERRESRDLLQDLEDVAAGYEVIHASDKKKAAAKAKSARRQKYKNDKERRRAYENSARKFEQTSLWDGTLPDSA